MADERIRVAMLHDPDADGLGDYLAHLVRALDEAGVRVEPVPVGPGGLTAGSRAAREVRRLHPDLVHVQLPSTAYRLPGLLPGLLPRATPLVTTLHADGDHDGHRAGRLATALRHLTDRLTPGSAAVVVTDPRIDVPGAAPVHIPVAPPVADQPGAATQGRRMRARLGLPEGAPLLAFLGPAGPEGGLGHLVRALPELRRAHPDLRLLVIGGGTVGDPADEPAALARRYAVADAVTVTGPVGPDRLSAALHAADVVVLPAVAGVGATSGELLTALAHGVPTAVTVPDGGDGEPHRAGAVAVIRQRADSAAIVAAVGRLLADPVLRRRLAERGRAFVAAYTWPRVAAAHLELYRRTLGRAGG
ncbi:glycosyltransferase family 4 protein [Micromonospora siamensis]|uniref:Glycosyltransferase involved in cell wall bisynthesis n=1 Tax=Micromonospora siamensis TaxID=299152 RepID=A0A1C5IAJ9_9ACTN|nr:glycosyltransferase family 4 protein [Micromonospora siamensis]SCG55440.1 Glycosyltransferase involved in cell wall bisynthesis [Micromonospora siamensis]